jgi:hypothetical protein
MLPSEPGIKKSGEMHFKRIKTKKFKQELGIQREMNQ